jgi:hypothetical protein
MTTTPYQTAWAKLRRLLPMPPPSKGWLYARLRIEAQMLGPDADDAMSSMERQLVLGSRLARVDDQATDWTVSETSWVFEQQAENGAQGTWLDIWGDVWGVPRFTAEPDLRYAHRILAEITKPKTTNLGMADVLDDALGLTGTKVLDAVDYYQIPRWNGPGWRLNYNTRMNAGVDLEGHSGYAMFVVVLYAGAINATLKARVEEIARRCHDAGTRHWRTYGTPGAPVPVLGVESGASFVPPAPSAVSLEWSDDSPTEAPATLVVASPDADPEGISLVT